MRTILINDIPLKIKDYYCCPCDSKFEPEDEGIYIPQDEPKLWLYVTVSDRCNAACSFCVNESRGTAEGIDFDRYEKALKIAAPFVSGVSFTGGEPMLDPPLLTSLIGMADSIIDKSAEFDMVTNGTNLKMLPAVNISGRLSTIHISRHAIDDEKNRRLMMWDDAPCWDDIRETVADLHDPGTVVLNCVLQKGGVRCMDDVCAYLEKAIYAGIQNTSFISMMPANTFCTDNYVSPGVLDVMTDSGVAEFNSTHDARITVWNRMRDHDYCKCLSGSYESPSGRTRFYFRCPGNSRDQEYCRQLVYTADNRLQTGFGSDSIDM